MTGEGSVLYDVYALSRAVGELLDDGLAGAPLSATEYAVYSFIFERGSVTPSEVSHALSMPRQTVSDWVALLRTREHVTVETNPSDGRSQLLSLSVAGRRAHRATNRRFEAVYRRFVDHLPGSEAAARALLAELIEAARIARGEHGPRIRGR